MVVTPAKFGTIAYGNSNFIFILLPLGEGAQRADEGLITSEIFGNWTREKTLIRPSGTFPRRGKDGNYLIQKNQVNR